ncbi:hypothetical protein [Pseudomonas sp. SCT]|uniref:hypothetical protein n=1 Tax=Pseudomonas sp. (strain SCT) TaxID=412955 RepID=UPI000F61B95C|nr:hypothetical protein [Pseudomonas sp. SCT]
MITPELRKQREEKQSQMDIVRKGIDMQLSGAVSRAEAARYWAGHLASLPVEVVAQALANHLPTTQQIEHALMKELLLSKR